MFSKTNLSYVGVVLMVAAFLFVSAEGDDGEFVVEETQTESNVSDGPDSSFAVDTDAPLVDSSDSGTNSPLLDSPPPTTTSAAAAGATSNTTTKPTWIQRIPKRKPKPAGE